MIAIIKYNAGNITSVQNALNRLGYKSIITDDEKEINNANKIIFPGVGEASTAMKYLIETGLDTIIKNTTKPLLGICLGQQLLCNFSEEGNTTCLGIFDANVKLFPPQNIVPHVGWNNIEVSKCNLFNGIHATDNFYFVHSYYAEVTNDTIATCNYILPFSAAMEKNNFYATQFHPEKSGSVGEMVLRSFLEM